MAVKPIPFSGPMIRALLEGRKTATRRVLVRLRGKFGEVIEFGLSDTTGYDWHFRDKGMRWHDLKHDELLKVLPYQVGDLLWVKENYRAGYGFDGYREDLGRCATPKDFIKEITPIEYLADETRELGGKSYPSMFMCQWMSRITLHVTGVKIERLQDISEADAIAEGVEFDELNEAWADYNPDIEERYWRDTAVGSFETLWESINGKGSWDRNDWVAVYTFERVK